MLRDVNNTSSVPHDNMIISCFVKPGLSFRVSSERKKVIPVGNSHILAKMSLQSKMPPSTHFHHVHYRKLQWLIRFLFHIVELSYCVVNVLP